MRVDSQQKGCRGRWIIQLGQLHCGDDAWPRSRQGCELRIGHKRSTRNSVWILFLPNPSKIYPHESNRSTFRSYLWKTARRSTNRSSNIWLALHYPQLTITDDQMPERMLRRRLTAPSMTSVFIWHGPPWLRLNDTRIPKHLLSL